MHATTRTAVTLAATAVLTAGLVAPVSAGPPGTAVTCGDTLTGVHHLAADLTCPGVAFTAVGHVTIELRGHVLRGGDVAFSLPLASPDESLTVRGGRIDGFGTVVQADGTAHAWDVRFERVTVTGSATVFRANDWGGPLTVDRSRVEGNAEVFRLQRFSQVTVTSSRLARNDVLVPSISDGGRLAISDSTLVDNRRLTGLVSLANLSVLRSTVRGMQEAVSPSTWVFTEVVGSTFVDNDVAVSIGANPARITDSVFRSNGVGFTASAPVGDIFEGPAQVLRNTFVRNGDGIVTEPGALVSLGDNRAVHNTGWGIFAPGATDLGGNTAHHNGRSPQCTGVLCGTS